MAKEKKADKPKKLNRLNVKTKQQTLFSLSLLHSNNFRKSRAKTPAGIKLYNEELDLVKKKVKQFGINLNKELPDKI